MSKVFDYSRPLPQVKLLDQGAILQPRMRLQQWWLLLASLVVCLLLILLVQSGSREDHENPPIVARQPLSQLLAQAALNASAEPVAMPVHAADSAVLALEQPALPQAAPAVAETAELRPQTWAPRRMDSERSPSDHAPVPQGLPLRIRVVTIRARVTAYTPYDHALTHPEWADGIVAWHPGGRQRRVRDHRYGLATDWSQFPPGATFIRVPGYMERSFPSFPENFRVVDDACGQSRIARRRGLQPVIDVRFMTRYSAIDPRGGWGSRQLDVEVIYPADFVVPASLRPWVRADEWHTYDAEGTLIARQAR